VKRALLLLALTAPAAAQELDLSRGGPVTVDARDGFEWRENERIVIATGDARATRGTSTVIAEKLVAYYRKKAAPTPAGTSAGAASTEGGNEIYRLVADGHVRIFTPTDEAQGEHAVYDIDQAVLVITGGKLRLTTPQQLITARDSLEYWSAKHMSVARGNAVVITSDARRLSGDVLVGYSEPAAADAPKPAKASDLPGGSGELKRIEAYGNVEVRTATDIVRGARGVYVTATQIARVVDNVRITHGDSQMNGAAADINMATGIAHLVSPPGRRVQGLIVPNSGKTPPGKTP
jgi:lipopolysaccharide export system protein LptA